MLKRVLVVLFVLLLLPSASEAQRHRLRKIPPAATPGGVATLPTDTNQIFLSEHTPRLGLNGWGTYEVDQSNGENGTGDGQPLTLAGLTYGKGFGVHAASELRFEMNHRCTAFKAVVGLDDETGSGGSVQFQVYGEYRYTRGSTHLYSSPILTGADDPLSLNIDTTGLDTLRLVVNDGGDGDASDHADWAFARVICTTPTHDVSVAPGANIQTAINNASNGQTILLARGVHTVTTAFSPKTSQSIVGEFGTVLYGGLALTSWTFVANGCGGADCWYASNITWTTNLSPDALLCRDDPTTSGPVLQYPCTEPSDVIVNRVPFVGTESLAALAGKTDRYYIDHTADRVYVPVNPNGKQVEIQRYSSPFSGAASGVSIKFLTVEMFTGNGINLSAGWVIEDTLVQFNHTDGIHMDVGSVARRVRVTYSGYQNFGGQGANILVEYSEHSYGNYAQYDPYWGGGGSKFVFTTNLIIRNNYSHDNWGVSWWADISNQYGTIANNHADDDERSCIFWEISYEAEIYGNDVRRCGFTEEVANEGFGNGIQVINSRGVKVYENFVYSSGSGIKCIHFESRAGIGGDNTDGAWECTNFESYSNFVCLENLRGQVNGLVSDRANSFTAGGNSIGPNNVYQTVASSPQIHWDNGERTLAQAQAYSGIEVGSTHTVVAACEF